MNPDSKALTAYLGPRRWFRAKARGLASAEIERSFPLRLDADDVSLAVLRCTYADGGHDRYVLPLATATGDEAARIAREQAHLVVASQGGAVTYDALGSVRLLGALLRLFAGEGAQVASGGATLVFRSLPAFAEANAANVAPRTATMEQTNTSVFYGDAFILKIIRQLDDGRSAELEMGEFLTQHRYASAPAVVGAIEIHGLGGAEPATVGIMHRLVPNEGDAWASALALLKKTSAPEAYAAKAALLGTRVGEMHVTLASGTEPAFAPERLSQGARAKLAVAVREQARGVSAWLAPGDLEKIAARVDAFAALGEDPVAMRVHGDLHLGQILATPSGDFVFVDFEGEPGRTLAERKAKRSPLADVAGMLRSFDYASATLRDQADGETKARAWYAATAAAFLAAYRDATRASAPLAAGGALFDATLDFYLLEKCLYEVAYEANNRPDWLPIPQGGLRRILGA